MWFVFKSISLDILIQFNLFGYGNEFFFFLLPVVGV